MEKLKRFILVVLIVLNTLVLIVHIWPMLVPEAEKWLSTIFSSMSLMYFMFVFIKKNRSISK